MSKAPPIGIEPEWAWRERRVIHLREAVERYVQKGQMWIIGYWLDEIERHELWLQEFRLEKKHRMKMKPIEMSNHETLELWLRLRDLGFEVEEETKP